MRQHAQAYVDGAVVTRKRITRAKLLEFFAGLLPCLVGIEACPSAHYWSRQRACDLVFVLSCAKSRTTGRGLTQRATSAKRVVTN
jgi:hypothetical protein